MWLASTGPRPRGRGNEFFELCYFDVTDDASTGPRPRGRGNKRVTDLSVHRQRCFNGAAPARARKSGF